MLFPIDVSIYAGDKTNASVVNGIFSQRILLTQPGTKKVAFGLCPLSMHILCRWWWNSMKIVYLSSAMRAANKKFDVLPPTTE